MAVNIKKTVLQLISDEGRRDQPKSLFSTSNSFSLGDRNLNSVQKQFTLHYG